MLTSKDIKKRLRDIEDYLLEEYKQSSEEKKRDWRTYEERLMYRIKKAIKNLEPLIEEATSSIKVHRESGRNPFLTVKQKLTLLLLKHLFRRSNRNMATMLAIFSLLSNIDVSYKTVERLYSDPEVEMAIYNLHILILRKKGVKAIDASGDGTGYSLSIKEHYASKASKGRNKIKKESDKKAFVYSFKILDLETKMYVAYGTSFRSEKKAFEKALKMLYAVDITIKSIRLDKYYSYPSYVDKFEEARVYVLPKKNATLKGSWKWKRTMRTFVEDTLPYLEEFYRRCNSESGFSVDKRWFGWKIEQRRWDRIDTASACTNVWYNLFHLY